MMKSRIFCIIVLLAFLSSVSYSQDLSEIKTNVKQTFNEWCKKGEFEKTVTWQERLKEHSVDAFDSICHDKILSAYPQNDDDQNIKMTLSEYNADNEDFTCTFSINDLNYLTKVAIPIGSAKAFKMSFDEHSIQTLSYQVTNKGIVPDLLLVQVCWKSYVVRLSSQDKWDNHISFDELGIENEYLVHHVYSYEKDTVSYVNVKCDPGAWVEVELTPAEFSGDYASWIQKQLKYPTSAAEQGIQGEVKVKFIVDKDGVIRNPKVISNSSGDDALQREAKRIVYMMPRWRPARLNGYPIRTKFVLPITFRLGKK